MAGWIIALALGSVTLLGLELWGRRRLFRPAQSELKEPKRPSLVEKPAVYYDVYVMSVRERMLVIGGSGLIACLIGYVFYKSFVLSLLISLAGFMFPQIWRQVMVRRRKEKLLIQFRQALYCLSSSLSAGKSVENAFRDALDDLMLLYIDPTTLIVQEFATIVQRLDNGEPIEQAAASFARRANEEDISNFVDVLMTCKRTGGNLVEVMRRTSAIIGEKLEIQAEITVMLAQKKFESRILTGAPILIIALLSLTSAEYMEPMFQGVGRLIMTVSLLVLGACFWYTQKMMRIAV